MFKPIQMLHSALTPEPAKYNATLLRRYNHSLVKRIKAGGIVNFVATRAMALVAFVPAYATTLGQAGYAFTILATVAFKKGSQLVGYNGNYSCETDAKAVKEHFKRAFKVAIYALTSTALSLLLVGVIVPRVIKHLDDAFGATNDQAVSGWIPRLIGGIAIGLMTAATVVDKYPKTTAFLVLGAFIRGCVWYPRAFFGIAAALALSRVVKSCSGKGDAAEDEYAEEEGYERPPASAPPYPERWPDHRIVSAEGSSLV